jgi:DNA-binding NarL/FixJ family response regulator
LGSAGRAEQHSTGLDTAIRAGIEDRGDRLTVLVAGPDGTNRARVRDAFVRDGFEVLAEARDAAGALEAAVRHRPQLCLLAVDLPGDGLLASRQIFVTLPGTKIAVLTDSITDDEAFEAIRCGADGYLRRGAPDERLGAAMRAIARGEPALPRALTARFVQDLREGPRVGEGEGHGLFSRAFLCVPRFARHLRRRLRANMPFGVACESARLRMREYR